MGDYLLYCSKGVLELIQGPESLRRTDWHLSGGDKIKKRTPFRVLSYCLLKLGIKPPEV